MEPPPNEKPLRTVPFAAQVARGIIRDRRVRRKMLGALLLIAVLMVIAGSTFLQGMLNPREHFGWFAIYWLACGWLTLTSLLLAVFDLLMVRAEERAARRLLREQVRSAVDSPNDKS